MTPRACLLLNGGDSAYTTGIRRHCFEPHDVCLQLQFCDCSKDEWQVVNWPLMHYRGQNPIQTPQIVRTACSKDVQIAYFGGTIVGGGSSIALLGPRTSSNTSEI